MQEVNGVSLSPISGEAGYGTQSSRKSFRDVANKVARDIKVQRLISGWHRKRNLCNRCKALDLKQNKFIILDHASDRSQQAYRYSLSGTNDTRRMAEFALGPSSGRQRLGTAREIHESNESCPFCSLVISSLPEREISTLKTSEKGDDVCYVSWQMDGRDLLSSPDTNGHHIPETRPRTRRIRLEWNKKSFPESYLVLVASEAKHSPDPTSQRLWESDAFFLGRYINSSTKNHTLVKYWLDTCDKHHGSLCHIEKSLKFKEMVTKSYFGVIDVHRMCLTHLPLDSRYVALSYMWGIGTRYTTILENVQNHQEPGGLEKVQSKLPRVIIEAIKLVRGMGEQYLWVDSLCIIQDSLKSWELNSGVMDLVYGNAHLTICAADGDGPGVGLRGLQPERKIRQHDELCVPGVRLMVSHLAETYIAASKWNTRAWTFQERLLSKRCLIFAEGRVYFQCRSAAMSEDIIAEAKTHTWSLELVHSPLQLLGELDTRALRVYMACVELYTTRILGRPKDILAAFRGLSNLLGERMGSRFLFGLPSSHFDLALLWEADGPVRMRESKDQGDTNDYGTEKFPTWSWSGWIPLEPGGATIRYTTPTIRDCLENVNMWLMEHTWINWYIRDGDGTLRPVWDGPRETEDQIRVENQWKGYKQPPLEPVADTCYDNYGRLIPPKLLRNPSQRPTRTLPEYPYCVKIAPPGTIPDHNLPDQRYLQFFTWSAFLRLLPQDPELSSRNGSVMRRYDIADYTGDWCGTIVLDREWGNKNAKETGSDHEFIAISDAKKFTREEKSLWTYYIPKKEEHSEWDLYFVLLVETRRGISRRVGLGKVFKEAFKNSCAPCQWKEFIME